MTEAQETALRKRFEDVEGFPIDEYIVNVKNSETDIEVLIICSLAYALSGAFYYALTPQGHPFWQKWQYKLEKIKP